MKTINELLQLLKFHYENGNQRFGLCSIIADMQDGVINFENAVKLMQYLKENIPVTIFYSCDGSESDDRDLFWYPVGISKLRLEWLNKHIELTSK